MAKIVIQGPRCHATLSEPDEDGDYTYAAQCGTASPQHWGAQPIEDMIQAAMGHVDRCTGRGPSLYDMGVR